MKRLFMLTLLVSCSGAMAFAQGPEKTMWRADDALKYADSLIEATDHSIEAADLVIETVDALVEDAGDAAEARGTEDAKDFLGHADKIIEAAKTAIAARTKLIESIHVLIEHTDKDVESTIQAVQAAQAKAGSPALTMALDKLRSADRRVEAALRRSGQGREGDRSSRSGSRDDRQGD